MGRRMENCHMKMASKRLEINKLVGIETNLKKSIVPSSLIPIYIATTKKIVHNDKFSKVWYEFR